MIVADRRGGEIAEKVEESPVLQGIMDITSLAFPEVYNDILISVDEQVLS
jgi:hypothetical protein